MPLRDRTLPHQLQFVVERTWHLAATCNCATWRLPFIPDDDCCARVKAAYAVHLVDANV